MNKLVLIAGLLCYLITAVVVTRQFSSAKTPRQVRLGILASYVGIATFAYLMLRDSHAVAALAASLAVFAASLVLLLWAAKTTRSSRLRLAFDPGSPGPIVRTGPYRYIRHPFYASYILFWLGCVVATANPLMLAFLAGFCAINLTAAYREERAFATSSFAEEYSSYRRTAGMLWPRFGVARQ